MTEQGSQTAVVRLPVKYQRPLRYLVYYLMAVAAGIPVAYIIAGNSPSAPDFATGRVYQMKRPGKGSSGFVFVTYESIMISRFFLAHLFAVPLLGLGALAWRVARNVIADSRYVETRSDV